MIAGRVSFPAGPDRCAGPVVVIFDRLEGGAAGRVFLSAAGALQVRAAGRAPLRDESTGSRWGFDLWAWAWGCPLWLVVGDPRSRRGPADVSSLPAARLNVRAYGVRS